MSQADPNKDDSPDAQNRQRQPWPAYLGVLGLVMLVSAYGLWGGQGADSGTAMLDGNAQTQSKEPTFMPKVNKSEDEWRAQLTPEQFEVTRRGGTEPAFTGKHWNNKEEGNYRCVCCGEPLFSSHTKYDSGCGWPSFYRSSNPENLHTLEDRKYGMLRTEVRCGNCGAHLGHLFDDGPQPTGMRYCMNSAALEFEKKKEEQKPAE